MIIYTQATIATILSWVYLKILNLTTDVQRFYQWDVEYIRDFLDTIKNNYPIPAITVFKRKNTYNVVDGRQRLTTIILYTLGEAAIKMDNVIKNTDSTSIKKAEENINFIEKEELSIKNNEFIKIQEILSYSIPFIIYEIDSSNQELNPNTIESLLFDRLNRNVDPMSHGNLYVSSLLTTLSFDIKNVKTINEIKEKKLPKIAKAFSYSDKKIIKYEIIKDIRSMIVFANMWKKGEKKVDRIRFTSELKTKEKKYISEESDSNKDKIKKNAEEELKEFNEAIDQILNWIKSNQDQNIKIGNLKNETIKKTLMFFILEKHNKFEKIIKENQKDVGTIFYDSYSNEKYKDDYLNKSGISTPARIRGLINTILNHEK